MSWKTCWSTCLFNKVQYLSYLVKSPSWWLIFPRNSPADIFEDHDNKNNNDNSDDDGKDITDDDNSGVQV